MISENIYSVLEVNNNIKKIIENNSLFLLPINIRGELSGYKLSSTGSIYFTLKDSTSKISCAIFKNVLNYELLQFKDGDQVVVNGTLSVWDKNGTYALTVKAMKKTGLGELYEQYEKLKREYQEKGYFDEVHKKPLPKYPKVIGVCTSPTGAVRHDIETTLNKRYPLVKMIIFPCTVQGVDAPKSIKDSIIRANENNDIDILIVGRGGGSFEDLNCFNHPLVIEAIFNSKIPVITAIGHETDSTISDFVSSKYAPTPTGAAAYATPDIQDLLSTISKYNSQIERSFVNALDSKNIDLEHYAKILTNLEPSKKINDYYLKINNYNSNINHYFKEILSNLNSKVSELFQEVIKKNPVNILTSYQNKTKNYSVLLDNLLVNIIKDKEKYILSLDNTIKINSPINLINKYNNNLSLVNTKLDYAYKNYLNSLDTQIERLQLKLTSLDPHNKGPLIKFNNNYINSIKDIRIKDTLEVEFIDGSVVTEVKEVKGEK